MPLCSVGHFPRERGKRDECSVCWIPAYIEMTCWCITLAPLRGAKGGVRIPLAPYAERRGRFLATLGMTWRARNDVESIPRSLRFAASPLIPPQRGGGKDRSARLSV